MDISSSGVCEIEEEREEEPEEVFEIRHLASIKGEVEAGSLFPFDHNDVEEDCVYVGIGKSESSSSMDALSWTLKNAVGESTVVYLIHVFPETHHIPSPLGRLPKSQVSAEQVEIYMAQERGKRREQLQKFLNLCSASKVKVETILIESDAVAKAILDLIPIFNMRRLVLGTTKSSLRKLRSRRGTGIACQVLQNAPACCEIKIVCDGKDVIDLTTGFPSPRGNEDNSTKSMQLLEQSDNESSSCMCFKPPRAIRY